MDISLALGGGGIKGIAHVGVIDCLLGEGFNIRAIAGTSVGGVVGALYATGSTPAQILALVEGLNPSTMYRRAPQDGPSLMGYTGLADALVSRLQDKTFDDLQIPFACTAVDLCTAAEVYLNQGKLIDAALATMAIPGVFPPKATGDARLIDGGVLDPVPVQLARLLAPGLPVVAVPLSPDRSQWDRLPIFSVLPPGALPLPSQIIEGLSRMRVGQALQIFAQSIDITSRMLTELRLASDRPEVIIRPEVHQYGMLDAVIPKIVYNAGFEAALASLPAIHRAGSWNGKLQYTIDGLFQSLFKPPDRTLPPSHKGERL